MRSASAATWIAVTTLRRSPATGACFARMPRVRRSTVLCRKRSRSMSCATSRAASASTSSSPQVARPTASPANAHIAPRSACNDSSCCRKSVRTGAPGMSRLVLASYPDLAVPNARSLALRHVASRRPDRAMPRGVLSGQLIRRVRFGGHAIPAVTRPNPHPARQTHSVAQRPRAQHLVERLGQFRGLRAGTSKPVTSWTTVSSMPPAADATTGTPHAMASTTGRQKGSYHDGAANTSADLRIPEDSLAQRVP